MQNILIIEQKSQYYIEEEAISLLDSSSNSL